MERLTPFFKLAVGKDASDTSHEPTGRVARLESQLQHLGGKCSKALQTYYPAAQCVKSAQPAMAIGAAHRPISGYLVRLQRALGCHWLRPSCHKSLT